ncbi:MAG TPA: thermonuclease family protein [Roseivirga sp.]
MLISASLLAQKHYGKVVAVADGDTFTLLTDDNKQIRVRLHGIDCPEKGQDFGAKAKQFTSRLVFNKWITVHQTDRDRYGRIVAIIPINGTTLNEMLLRNGLAWHYCKYDKREDWHYLQDSASAVKVGLWSMPSIAPWEYRKSK